MASPDYSPDRTPGVLERRRFLKLLSLAALGPLTGCAMPRWFGRTNSVGYAQCAMTEETPTEEIVDFLNGNTNNLRSWRTTRVGITIRGASAVPISVGATIAVESPLNFRLVASNPMGLPEADFGSNEDQFWFWNKHNDQKYVFVAGHDQRTRKIPFQPDWIMESMGVVAIAADEITDREPGPPGTHTVLLGATRRSPDGAKVRKVTVVDVRRGLITEHALYDARGQLIARALLGAHVRDKSSGNVIPTKIELDWPPAKLGMTMTLSDVEVNPKRISAQTWARPEIPGYDVYDLSA